MSTVWTHPNLCHDLAAHLSMQGYRAWIESRRVGVVSYGDAGRVDVLAMSRWTGRTKFEMIAFEIKISRADLMRDVTSGKWRRYGTEYGIKNVAFACVEGIAKADDIPAEAGLWVREADGWKRKRAPRSLNNDQRKIDPLLLLQLVDTPPFSLGRSPRSFDDLVRKSRIPREIVTLLEGVKDDWFRDYLARYAAKRTGEEFAKRLRNNDAAKVNRWCEEFLAWLAPFVDKTPDELAQEAIWSGNRGEFRAPHELTEALKQARKLASRAALVKEILSEAESLLNSYGLDVDEENDRMVLDAIKDASKKRRDAHFKKAKTA